MTSNVRRGLLLGAAVAGLLLTAACTAAVPGRPSTRPSASLPPSTESSSVAPSSSSPPPSLSPSAHRHRHHPRHTAPPTTPPAPTSASPTYPPTTTAPPPAPKSTCRNVGVRVIPGGAAEGTEIAALQFTNDGKHNCTLVGYAGVMLSKRGNDVGTPSQPGGPYPGRSVPVAPGQTVQSMLRDYSSCQAPLSDTARVTLPGETTMVTRPIQLRACTLRVGQLGPPH